MYTRPAGVLAEPDFSELRLQGLDLNQVLAEQIWNSLLRFLAACWLCCFPPGFEREKSASVLCLRRLQEELKRTVSESVGLA